MARILIVDDDPDFVEICRMILEKASYEVDSAASGREALEHIRESAPRLVILDVMMEGVLDGLDVAHQMEEDHFMHNIPIIMVSSIADSPMAGMFPTDDYLPVDAWISKPVRPEGLLKKVDQLIGPAKAA